MVALRQCISLPAALTNRSLFKELAHVFPNRKQAFHSAVCSGNPRLARMRVSANKRKPVSIHSLKKPPPPVISITGSKPTPNVYRDFSDGDDEPERNTVIQLRPSDAKKPMRRTQEPRPKKPPRKQLRFSDTEDDEELKTPQGLSKPSPGLTKPLEKPSQFSDSEDEEDDDYDEQDGKPELLTLPEEDNGQAILHEKFIPQHLEGKPTRQLFGSNIHVRTDASRVMVNRVEFIKSSSNVNECPMDGFPEFAFVGRSNVGKSSLVNLLVERKKLALVSKKPGKTQLINHYLVNKAWYLVDLPGYGYAVAPKSVCVEWNEFTKEYFLKRKTLVMVVQLVDAAIPPQQIDIDCAAWLKKQNIPTTLAFTKCDKRRKKRRGGRHAVENVVDFLSRLRMVTSQTYPWILTSCLSGQGREELMLHMEEYRRFWHT